MSTANVIKESLLSQELVRNLFSYCEQSGILRWKTINIHARFMKVGDEVGFKNKKTGYRTIKINSIAYQSHRVIWLYVYGKFPNNYIDHINGIKDDNRICNLRDVTQAENNQNLLKARKVSKSGYLGVFKKPDCKRYRAELSANGERISLGSFATAEEASKAYLNAKREHHKFCTI